MPNVSLKKAAFINFIGKYTNIIIQLVYSAILSRILTPKDFGVVAVVTVFTSFFILIANMGIGPAIVQKRDMEEEDINHIFTFTIYIGIIMGILFAIFSIPLSVFYGNKVYLSIGLLLSISLFFNTLNVVPNAILLKKHKFKLVSLRMVIVTIGAAIPTIFLALIGFKYYAIVINSILISFLAFLWNYITTRPKFVFKIEKNRISKIKDFSMYQMGFSFINYFSRNMDNLLIGRFIGEGALGYYDKSYKLMRYPVQNLTHVITPVLHPVLSAHQDDEKYIYSQYIKIVKILSLLGVFITVYSFFASEEIILIMFGEQWVKSILSFKILSISIFFQMTVSSAGSIYQSLDNTKVMFKSGVIFTIITVICIIIGISIGDINAVALLITISLILKFFIDYYFLINECFGYSVIEFYKIFIPDTIIFIILFISMHLASSIMIENILLSSIYKFFIAFIVYIILLFITKQNKYLFTLLPKIKKKK